MALYERVRLWLVPPLLVPAGLGLLAWAVAASQC